MDAQPGCGFLSLQIHSLKSHVINKGWDLVSHRASLFSPQHASETAAQLVKEQQEHVEKQEQLKRERELQQKEKLEQRRLQSQNVAFVTFKFSVAALERSQLPCAQTLRARRVIEIASVPSRDLETSNTYPSALQNETSAPLSSSIANELKSEERPVTRSVSNLSIIDTRDPGLTHHGTSEASESLPATPLDRPFSSIPEAIPDLENGSRHPVHGYLSFEDPYAMSGKPSIDAGGVDESIKDVIQSLFVMQQHVASFRPEIQDGLNRKVEDLAVSLQKLDDLVVRPSNPIHNIKIAPDIIDYVDDGRNPDIYTRDFVELVQRGNAVLNGKQRAFRNFSKIFAKSLKENFEGMDEEVDSIMENAGMEEKDGKFIEKQQNGGAA